MSARFQPSYSAFRPYGVEDEGASSSAAEGAASGFEMTPEAQEGLIALLATGTKLTQQAIEARAKAKARKRKKKASSMSRSRPKDLRPVSPVYEAPEPSGVSAQTVLLGLGPLAVVGGAAWYMGQRTRPLGAA